MDYSLLTHNKGYQFPLSDACYTALTGFSGAPFASRHWELGHRAIALIEYTPVLGGIVALIERVIYAVLGSRYSEVSWRDKPLTKEEANSRMKKNLAKAVREHQRVSDAYATPSQAFTKNPEKLDFTIETSEDIGPRPTMEDAKFVKETSEYILAGVFDGHGGSKVSEFAAKEFEKRFPQALKECDHPAAAFEKVFHEIQQDIARHGSWNRMGSTAVVVYVDKSTKDVYTATIGDSEAKIYRDMGRFFSSMKSIPLSVIRDWASPNERKRLEQVHGKDRVAEHFKRARYYAIQRNEKSCAKYVYSRLDGGVNTSRALGDVNERGTHFQPVVTDKPIITYTQMKKGDTLVLSCDGLIDSIKNEARIVEVVKSRPEKLAAELVKEAIHSMKQDRGDNVTVIAIKV